MEVRLLRRAAVLGVVCLAACVGQSAAAWAGGLPDGVTWTARTSAAPNQWRDVTYGNGRFVAVAATGSGNRAMTSPDGVTWTARSTPADNLWNSVTYANGMFVAVAYSGMGNRVMTSPDGITWTARSTPADNEWFSVVYGDGLFVAVARTGSGNQVMTSPDGVTWTARSTPVGNEWTNVTYGKGLFVAVARSGTGDRVMTSPDGITWTARTSAADNSWRGVTYGNGLFVAVAFSGVGNRVMTSPDGITWTTRTSAADNEWLNVSYANGLFVTVARTGSGNRVMTSPDGITWTTRASAVNNQWYGITYAHGLWVTVADTGANDRVMTNGTFDATPPGAVSVSGGPVEGAVLATSEDVVFGFSAVDPPGGTGVVGYRCRLDGPGLSGGWVDCSASERFSGLRDGAYSLSVRAVDGAQGLGPVVTRSWEIDTTVPSVEVVDVSVRAGAVTVDPGFRARLRASESGVRFECRLGDGVWKDCSDRPRFEGLLGGRQVFSARVIDRAGNVSAVVTHQWTVQGADAPLEIKQPVGTDRMLRCESAELRGVGTVTYQWRRDGKPIDVASGNYAVSSRDSGSRLTCTAIVTFPSGMTARYTAPPVIVDGTTRLGAMAATISKARGPIATFTLNQANLVIVRLWCRSKTSACKPPSGPTDYVKPARASYVPAGLVKYRRIVMTAKAGTNTITLNDYLPKGLPAGDYKITIRLARRNPTGGLITTNFTSQELNIPATPR